MNYFKWQYLVGESSCKMDFPTATRIPSFDNSVWIHLPVCIITVDVKHRQPTHAIFHFCLQSREPRKTSLVYRNWLVMLEVALTSHEHLCTCQRQHKKLSSVLTNCKLQRIHFATHLSTSRGRLFGYGKSFMYSVFMSLTISGFTLFTRAGTRQLP